MMTPAGQGFKRFKILVRRYTSSEQLETGSREHDMNDGGELTESHSRYVGPQTHQDANIRTGHTSLGCYLRGYNDGTPVQTCLTEVKPVTGSIS